MIPSWLTLKLGGMILGAVAIIGFVLMAFHWKHQAADRKEKLEVICKATRDANNMPKLNCGGVPDQIRFMGDAINALHVSLDRQNAAVKAMGEASANAQKEAEKAISASKERVKGAQGQSDRLAASARDPARQKQPCEPSKELTGAWR
jgi:hypothetical protein